MWMERPGATPGAIGWDGRPPIYAATRSGGTPLTCLHRLARGVTIRTHAEPQPGGTHACRRRGLLQLVHFTWSSGIGLITDLAVFSALVYVGGDAFRANIASASIAITLAYFLVTRYSFRAIPTWRTYAAFVLWYATSATLVSLTIDAIAQGDRGTALAVKLCTVPITFGTNFLFGRWLFAGGAERVLGAMHFRPPLLVARVLSSVPAHRVTLIAAGISLWYLTLIVPITSRVGFMAPGDRAASDRWFWLHVVFALVLWAAAWFAITFVRHVRAGSRRHRTWLIAGAALLSANLGVLLLTFPGLWIWDEFRVIGMARVYSDWGWQNYLTSIYYTVCLYLIPTGVSIVVVQMVFAAVVGGYVVSTLREHLTRPWLAALCALPLLSFATLLSDAYPLRLTPYAYLLALALTRVVVAWQSAKPIEPLALFGFITLVALLAFWRTEGIVFLALIPIYAVAGRLHLTWRTRRGLVVTASIAGALAILVTNQAARQGYDPNYQVTAYVNPLSTMLQHPLQSPTLSKDIAAIDRVIDVNVLRENPSHLEIPAYWLVGARPGFEAALPGLQAAYVNLVLNNPTYFLENRWQAFLAANSMQPDYLPLIHGGGVGAFNNEPEGAGTFRTFVETNYFSKPLSESLRSSAIKALLLTDANRSSPFSSVVWNAVPMLAAAFIVLGWALLKRRRWPWVVCAAAVLIQAAVVFLTAPGAFFMYYFPAYVVGGLLATALLTLRIDAFLAQRIVARSTPTSFHTKPLTAELINA